MGDTLEAVRKGGKAHDEVDPAKGPEAVAPTVNPDEAVLFDNEDASDEKALKLRLLYKGTSLDNVLAVTGAEAVEGEKQTAFKVKALGNRDIAEVLRAMWERAHAAGVTLKDILALIRAKGAGVNAKETLDKLYEQATRKSEAK